MQKAQIGMIGLGTMGRNLVLNIADHGFKIIGYDKDAAQQERLKNEQHPNVQVVADVKKFIENLELPRKIILLVPAGKIVDFVLADIIPLLQKEDIVIDGGNSHYTDTDRRFAQLQTLGLHFMGMGVSGGEEGARKGPSLMPGSNLKSYEAVKPILMAIAAKANGEPCVAFIGNGAAGHYTKMVHNGIEYAMMQLISEVYDLLKNIGNLTNAELHQFFDSCNKGRLQGYLIEITTEIFLKKDADTESFLVDKILDKAKQKGTGMWTSQSAMELNVPLSIIDAAVSMRYVSALKNDRINLANLYKKENQEISISKEALIKDCENALYYGFALCYIQGLNVLNAASIAYKYEVNLPEILTVWKGGCIIRSGLLDTFKKAFTSEQPVTNAMETSELIIPLLEGNKAVKNLLNYAMQMNIPTTALSAALNYFTASTTAFLPANLIQAQRDFFGAHSYERIDKEGVFHTEWESI
jgi:6-phosphogluconate dehydrogenase